MKHSSETTDANLLKITRTQLSRLCAGGAFLGFFLFVSGYFLGKVIVLREVASEREAIAFADHLQQAVSTLYPQAGSQQQNDTISLMSENEESGPYKAIIRAFGSKVAAQTYVDELKKQEINTNIIKRVSQAVSPRGDSKKEISWYQVSTDTYETIDDLMAQVEKIKGIASTQGA